MAPYGGIMEKKLWIIWSGKVKDLDIKKLEKAIKK